MAYEADTGDGQDATDPTELFERLKCWYKESVKHLAEWREQAEEDFAFVAGDQWTAEDRALLAKQQRPEITFNRTAPVIEAVTGTEITNRQEIHYYPREVSDSGKSDMISAAAKFFRQEAQTEDEESDAFRDTVICGIGATEIRMDYETDAEGMIPTTRLDPLSVFYDPGASKRNLMDRRYCGYAKQISLDDAKALFPDAEDEDFHAPWVINPQTGAAGEQKYGADTYQGDSTPTAGGDYGKKVTIVYFEWWDREPFWLVKDPATGEDTQISTEDWPTLKERAAIVMPGVEIQAVQTTRKVYKAAYLGNKVLKEGPGRCPEHFSVNFITGRRDRNENTFYGLTRAMKDPQRWANKFFSQILHIVNSNAKGGLLVETGAVENVRKFEETWADPNGITWVKTGMLGKGGVQPKPAITYPAGLDKMMEYSIMAIPQTTGVNFELMGMVEREQAGVLERQRKQSGLTMLATLFDNLRQYRKTAGTVMLHLIQTGVPPGRLIRIDSENGPQYAPLLADPQTKYDIIVDEASNSINQKELVWGMLVQMMPILTKQPLGGDIWADILKYSPLPASVSSKIGEKLVAASQQPPPPDPAMVKAQADLEKQQVQMQMDQQKGQQQMQLAQEKAQLDATIKMENAQLQAQIDTMAAKQDMAIEQFKAQMQMALAENKNEADTRIKESESKAEAKSKPAVALQLPDQMLTEVTQGIAQQTQMIGGIAESFQQTAQALVQAAQALAAPKALTVTRGKDGKIAGGTSTPANGAIH